MNNHVIYLDNAATSWPKPPTVLDAIAHYMRDVGANPGRSGHRLAVAAGRVLYDAREAVAALLGAPDPLRVVFGQNATEGLNLALRGLLRRGDHVITSSMEHNAVMRPLRALEREGVQLTVVRCAGDGRLEPADVAHAIMPHTRMIVMNHASNVCGTLLPVAEVGEIARRRDILFLVDAAQTAGAYPIDMEKMGIDLLAFTGHKSLYGPMGTGGLIIGARVDERHLRPLKRGGTGSRSEQEEQPDFLPDLCESGTPNAPGLAGLAAGIAWVQARGVAAIRAHETALAGKLIEGLRAISRVTVYGPLDPAAQTATVSFTIAGVDVGEASVRLDEEFGVLCRVGLHCAPAAHRTLGTFPAGTIRFGLGAMNTPAEVDGALAAVRALAEGA